MFVKTEIINYGQLKEMCWCNESNFAKIERYNLEDEFFDYVEQIFSDDVYEDTVINDTIRFDENIEAFIGEHLDFDYVDNIEELLEIAKDLYYDAEDTISEAIENGKAEQLWNYLQEQFSNESLDEVYKFIEEDLDLEEEEE
jgi:hypothetical protein